MVSRISVSDLKRLLEEQKQEAISGIVHVWSDSTTSHIVNNTCNKINGITKNPNQFVSHSYSRNSNQIQVINQMAECFSRILIICLYATNNPAAAKWAESVFPAFFNDMPFADLRIIDISNLLKSDTDYLFSLHVEANPTVLIAKMGHIIDNFHPNVTCDQPLADALLQRHREIESQKGRPLTTGDEAYVMMPNYDHGKADYEERQRQKMIQEQEKERRAKHEEERIIKARIAEQRRFKRQGNRP